MKKLHSIGVGKATLFGAVLSAVYVFILAVVLWFLQLVGFIGQGKFLESFLGLTVGTFFGAVFAGLLAAVGGAISGLVFALLYNIVAGIMGGLEVELKD
jgi:hypothetical protein